MSSDHGSHSAATLKLGRDEAAALFAKGMAGTASTAEAFAFEAHMMYQQAAMAVEDGLVMTMHPGVHRNTHSATLAAFGPDTGHDIPFAVDFATGLQPLLNDFGTAKGSTSCPSPSTRPCSPARSRRWPASTPRSSSARRGGSWTRPDAMMRFRSAVTETAGFSRSSGFIDDTRAFCSIPARHDASRRVEAAFLARLVAEHRITEERAHEIIVDIVDAAPRRAFKL